MTWRPSGRFQNFIARLPRCDARRSSKRPCDVSRNSAMRASRCARISAAAGVSIGLINHHFPSKAGLVAEAYETLALSLQDSTRRQAENRAVAPARPIERFLSSLLRAGDSRPRPVQRVAGVLEHGCALPRRSVPCTTRPTANTGRSWKGCWDKLSQSQAAPAVQAEACGPLHSRRCSTACGWN